MVHPTVTAHSPHRRIFQVIFGNRDGGRASWGVFQVFLCKIIAGCVADSVHMPYKTLNAHIPHHSPDITISQSTTGHLYCPGEASLRALVVIGGNSGSIRTNVSASAEIRGPKEE